SWRRSDVTSSCSHFKLMRRDFRQVLRIVSNERQWIGSESFRGGVDGEQGGAGFSLIAALPRFRDRHVGSCIAVTYDCRIDRRACRSIEVVVPKVRVQVEVQVQGWK